MKTVKIHCIEMRAKRLAQPDMIGRYHDMAISWGHDICELDDGDHTELNTLWNETGKPRPRTTRGPCKSCRGL